MREEDVPKYKKACDYIRNRNMHVTPRDENERRHEAVLSRLEKNIGHYLGLPEKALIFRHPLIEEENTDIDLVAITENSFYFIEIKTNSDPNIARRKAKDQLMRAYRFFKEAFNIRPTLIYFGEGAYIRELTEEGKFIPYTTDELTRKIRIALS